MSGQYSSLGFRNVGCADSGCGQPIPVSVIICVKVDGCTQVIFNQGAQVVVPDAPSPSEPVFRWDAPSGYQTRGSECQTFQFNKLMNPHQALRIRFCSRSDASCAYDCDPTVFENAITSFTVDGRPYVPTINDAIGETLQNGAFVGCVATPCQTTESGEPGYWASCAAIPQGAEIIIPEIGNPQFVVVPPL